ncbi:pupal cuticle protein 27-like [Plutella xylostella]|uniref:pupal cuticle protein 27-like n=1 Tax=Plutella xylostella TaxID=51655 RepID=UPI002032A395|nr:pupal cuticle protein 27-like [Plutella xylostella]
MVKFVVLLCIMSVSYAVGAPSFAATAARRALPALQHEEIHDSFGQYALRYVTAEGTIVSQRARLVPSGAGHVLVTEGETTFIGTDGKTYVTRFTAGPEGLKVEGDHLPKAPVV